jgi:hypothetical protein
MHPILLIGSFPYASAREVFDVAGPALAGVAKRIPDGEVQGWNTFPAATLAKATIAPHGRGHSGVRGEDQNALEPSGRTARMQPEMPAYPLWHIKPSVAPDSIRFAPVGYDTIALASYDAFRAARRDGTIAPGTKFQVSLPTPFATIGARVVPEQVPAVLPAFERHYFSEVDAIVAAIPAQDLAFQWDVAVEIIQSLEGNRPGLKEHAPLPFLAAALARAIARVPATVECGFHLCYGNPGGRHIIEPKDMGVMVALANATFEALGEASSSAVRDASRKDSTRPVTWLHMPVPKERDDDAYFAPLADLRLPPETELYLGLVHLSDGIEGAKRRIAAAKRYMPNFGVGYECGLRAFPKETIGDMLSLHKAVAALE